jgi:hypothetical protein
MSMIGKLRQVSEFDLARFKKNPNEMVRALAGTQLPGDAGKLRSFYDDAATKGNAVLLWIE